MKYQSRPEAIDLCHTRDRADSYRPQYSTSHQDYHKLETHHDRRPERTNSAAGYVGRINDPTCRIRDTRTAADFEWSETRSSVKRKVSPSGRDDGRLCPWRNSATFAVEPEYRETKRRLPSMDVDNENQSTQANEPTATDNVVGKTSMAQADEFLRSLGVEPKPPISPTDSFALTEVEKMNVQLRGDPRSILAEAAALQDIDSSGLIRVRILELSTSAVLPAPHINCTLGDAEDAFEPDSSGTTVEMQNCEGTEKGEPESVAIQPQWTQISGLGTTYATDKDTAKSGRSSAAGSASQTPAVHPIVARLKSGPRSEKFIVSKRRTNAAEAWHLSRWTDTACHMSPSDSVRSRPVANPDAGRSASEPISNLEEGEISTPQPRGPEHQDGSTAQSAATASPRRLTATPRGLPNSTCVETLSYRNRD